MGAPSGAGCSYQPCWIRWLLSLTSATSFSLSLGTNQWQRASGQTPSSPNYENSLHSLVSFLSASIFKWVQDMMDAHLDKLHIQTGLALHGDSCLTNVLLKKVGVEGKPNWTIPVPWGLPSVLYSVGQDWDDSYRMGLVKGDWCGGGSCLLHHFSRIPLLPYDPSYRSTFIPPATWCMSSIYIFCWEFFHMQEYLVI